MRKTSVIRIISFCIAAVTVATAFAIKTHITNNKYELALENNFSRSLEDLGASINNLSLTLSKARFVTTPEQISNISARLLTEAEISKSALSQLPSADRLTSLNKFLSQVGNYAMSVSKELISGNSLNDEHSKNIEKLSLAAEKISQAVSDSLINYNNSDYWANELENKIESSVDSFSLEEALGTVEDSFSDYPTLIYDGPYSDHLFEKTPLMLEGTSEISREEALKVAAQFAECNTKALTPSGETSGKLPSYRFEGEKLTVAVTKRGGYAIYMRRERNIETSLISYEQAILKAKRYLNHIKLTNLTETYYFTNEGVCIINFAFMDGKTICYTDLIKVGVAMDTGEIMFYEASGYITNHTSRAFETPTHTAEEASALINPSLKINRTALALIPTENEKEVRCYEFYCTSADSKELLIYINVLTLKEEDILILLRSDGGTLVK